MSTFQQLEWAASSCCAVGSNSYKLDLAFAERLVTSAGRLAQDSFRTDVRSWVKGRAADIATDADVAVQRFMLDAVAKHRPFDGVIAEEGPVREIRRRTWLLDPIDGTLAFHRGLPLWCTAAALLDEGACVLSAIYDPLAGEVYSAEGEIGGAVRNGEVIRCAATTEIEHALVHTWIDPGAMAVVGFESALAELSRRALAVKSGGSGSQGLAWVAGGRLDAFVEVYSGENEWDWVPGEFLVRRAGGVVMRRGPWRVAAGTEELVTAVATLLKDVCMP